MDPFFDILLRVGLDAAGLLAKLPAPGGRLYSNFDLGDVVEQMTRLLAEDADNVRARFLRGAAYQSEQRYAEALADFDAVLARAPNHARALLLRSEIHFLMGEQASGQADRQKALELDPTLCGRTASP